MQIYGDESFSGRAQEHWPTCRFSPPSNQRGDFHFCVSGILNRPIKDWVFISVAQLECGQVVVEPFMEMDSSNRGFPCFFGFCFLGKNLIEIFIYCFGLKEDRYNLHSENDFR